MRLAWPATLLLLFFCSLSAHAQVVAPPAAAGGVVDAPSGLVQPSLRTVRQSLEMVSVDRWKAPKLVKESTTANLGSIHRDLETTLPGLLAAADAAPGSVGGMVPVSQNLGALYDVLLRVTVVAQGAAPAEQIAALQRATASLEGARRTFTERLQATAEAEDRRVAELQTALSARPAPVTRVDAGPVPCKPAPAARPKKAAAKPASSPGK